MASMFSQNYKKQIPKTLEECSQPDDTAFNLHFWAERLEAWGKFLFILIIIVGIIATINLAIDTDEDNVAMICVTSAITWAFWAFIEYCSYHILALIIYALGSITENTNIAANVALYTAAKEKGNTQPSSDDEHTSSKSTYSTQRKSSAKAPDITFNAPAGYRICKNCGRQNTQDRKTCWNCNEPF